MTGSDQHLFAGRFVIREMLGSGGSAAVFRAHDEERDREVALKVLHSPLQEGSPLLDRFLGGARRAAAVRNDRVARVLGFGVDEVGTAWIAMPLVAGATVQDLVSTGGRLSVEEAIRVAAEVLAALEAVHAAGLVHRDVTPGNVMVSREGDGSVTLLDLGLADVVGRSSTVDTDEGVAMVEGSVHYMSPEQAAGLPIDAAADLYQVGAVLYFCLTGRPPFPRVDAAATMRAHLSSPPPIASALAPDVPRGLDRVIVRAMLKDPRARYPDAEHMLADLSGLAAVVPAKVVADAATQVLPATVRPALDRTVRLASAGAAAGAAAAVAGPPAGARRRRGAAPVAVSLAGAVAISSMLVWVVTAGAADSAPLPVSSSAAPVAEAPAPTPSAPQAIIEAPPAPEPEPVIVVPDLTGLSFDRASAELAALGLTLGAITTEDGSTPRSTVLRTSPGMGTELKSGSTLDLVVASGASRVPQLVALDAASAIAELQAAGFVADLSGPQDGEVRSTVPGGGELLELGQPVTLVTAERAPSTPTPTPTGAPAPIVTFR